MYTCVYVFIWYSNYVCVSARNYLSYTYRHLSFMDVHGHLNTIPSIAALHEVIRSPVYPIHTHQSYIHTPTATSSHTHTLQTSLHTQHTYTHHKHFAYTSSVYVQDAYMVDRKTHVCQNNLASMFLHIRLGAVLTNYDDLSVTKVGDGIDDGISRDRNRDEDEEGMSASEGDEEDNLMGREGADTLIHCAETLQHALANIQTRRLAYREHASIIIQNFYKAYVYTRLALVVYKVVGV
ncbi:hypothetical protein EON63_21650, partial [archaeon]